MKVRKFFSMASLAIIAALALSSCSKENIQTTLDQTIGTEVANFTVPHSGYDIEVTEALEKPSDFEFNTSGSMRYTLNGEVIATVDFGDGKRDHVALLTKDNDKELLDLSGEYGYMDDDWGCDCFEDMLDDSLGCDDWYDDLDSLACDSLYDDLDSLDCDCDCGCDDFYDDDWDDGCGDDDDWKDKDGDKDELKKVIVEPLVKADDCKYIISGVIKYFDGKKWVATIDFGDGTCDDVATKKTKDGETAFSLSEDKK